MLTRPRTARLMRALFWQNPVETAKSCLPLTGQTKHPERVSLEKAATRLEIVSEKLAARLLNSFAKVLERIETALGVD